MKIYSLSIVKNEADIISYMLDSACEYADKVIVYDNGSDDGTWEIINQRANDQIVPFKQDHKPYSDGMRAEIFDTFKHELSGDDWWVIQDSDEFYEDNPKEFLKKNTGIFHHVNGCKVDFCFAPDHPQSNFSGDFEVDMKFMNYFYQTAWSEPRMILNRSGMIWNEKEVWPRYMGISCEDVINIRHYPQRSPDQIIKRKSIRDEAMKRGGQRFVHWENENFLDKEAPIPAADVEVLFNSISIANNWKTSALKKIAYRLLFSLKIIK